MNDENKINELLINILGENALDNNMKVSKSISKLAKSVKYMTTQLKITKQFCEEQGKEHINDVLKHVEDILINHE